MACKRIEFDFKATAHIQIYKENKNVTFLSKAKNDISIRTCCDRSNSTGESCWIKCVFSPIDKEN
jgi:hypothetical protein